MSSSAITFDVSAVPARHRLGNTNARAAAPCTSRGDLLGGNGFRKFACGARRWQRQPSCCSRCECTCSSSCLGFGVVAGHAIWLLRGTSGSFRHGPASHRGRRAEGRRGGDARSAAELVAAAVASVFGAPTSDASNAAVSLSARSPRTSELVLVRRRRPRRGRLDVRCTGRGGGPNFVRVVAPASSPPVVPPRPSGRHLLSPPLLTLRQ